MNTHEVLKEYHGTPGYPAMAQAAAAYARRFPQTTEEQLLERIGIEFKPQSRVTMRTSSGAPYFTFGPHLIEEGAYKQMEMVMRLPVAVSGALMPDAHPGYAMPIGGVALLQDAVSPSLVGFDIGCMVFASLYRIPRQEFEENIGWFADAVRASTSFGMGATTPVGQSTIYDAVLRDPAWNSTSILRSLKSLAERQFGSSGGGNHFADLMEVKWNGWTIPNQGVIEIALVTHFGSRGPGHKVATYYSEMAKKETNRVSYDIPPGYEWLDTRKDSGREYLEAMELMGAYAVAGHKSVHATFSQKIGITSHDHYWNRHNYAWVQDTGKVLHRKGATPADQGTIGIIPGSSGTASYIVSGLGNAASLQSASHGAGRPFSRTEAKKRHDPEATTKALQGIVTSGLTPDETPGAYKDIESVMYAQKALVKPIAKMTPRVVIMGGASDDGD